MPSVRTSLSLDVLTDHDLIERLAALQSEGRASEEIRTALREHFGIQVTLQDVVDRLERIEAQLDGLRVESSVGGGVQPEPRATSDTELEHKLNAALGRFRRD